MPTESFNNTEPSDLKENNYKKVINEFSIDTINQFFQRRKKVIYLSFLVFIVVFFTKTIYTRFTAPIFQATFSLLIKDPINLSSQRKTFNNNIFEDLVAPDQSQDIATLISLLKSPIVLSELSKKYETPIAQNLSISLGEGASGKRSQRDKVARGVLNFTYLDGNPKKAEKILGEISQIYLKLAYDQNQKRISQVLDFLKKQEPIITETSLIAQNELEKFRLKNNVVDPVLTLKYMKEKELVLENQLAAAKSAFVPNSQIIISLENNLKNLKEKFSNKALFIKEYEQILQKISLSRENLKSLILAKEKFQLEMAKNSVPWTIISVPSSSNIPVYPNLKREFLRDIVLSFILAIILGYLRERFDNVFHSPSELKQFDNRPILESIPYFEMLVGVRENKINLIEAIDFEKQIKNNSKEKQYERFIYQESFRNLYTSIRFLSTDNPIKTIVLTSSIPNEGKSTISLIISKTISDMDKKVLIIDGDLRKPQLHNRVGIDNLNGLSNLITDKDKQWQSAVSSISNYKNLSVMTAGITPPDPTRLLSSQRMREIISSIKDSKKFDYIFIDTPPILGLSDTPLISNLCDGTILLVSLENLDKNLLPQSLNKINENKINLLGFITTQKKKPLKNQNNGSGGYGYSNDIYAGYYSNEEPTEEDQEQNNKDLDSGNNLKDSLNKLKNNLKLKILNLLRNLFNWLDN